eukprot:jgi/Picre1/33557/NNA_008878.t1
MLRGLWWKLGTRPSPPRRCVMCVFYSLLAAVRSDCDTGLVAASGRCRVPSGPRPAECLFESGCCTGPRILVWTTEECARAPPVSLAFRIGMYTW